jgi:hypothetical protein
MLGRWRIWIVALAVLALLGVALIWSLYRPDPISRRNANRIEPGMTVAQVENLLGRKPDEVMTVGGSYFGHFWLGPSGSVLVRFDDEGLVVSRMFTPSGEESPIDGLISWLPW